MPAIESHLRRGPRVLIVEDEPRLRQLLAEEIPDMGFATATARSAEEACRLMEGDPHEIMLLDLQLPAMGGMDLFDQVRKQWPATQVIVLTGFGDLHSAQRAIHLDVVDFLSKPCPLRDVEMALDRARRKLGAAVAGVNETPTKKVAAEAVSTLEQSEREQIMAALARNNGNRTATARQLGISRRTLHYRLREYDQQGYEVR